MSPRRIALICAFLPILAALAAAAASAADWKEVQAIKRRCVSLAAQHAMAQQKRTASPPVAIPLPTRPATTGKVRLLSAAPGAISVEMAAAPRPYMQPVADTIRIPLPRPMNLVEGHRTRGHGALRAPLRHAAGVGALRRWSR